MHSSGSSCLTCMASFETNASGKWPNWATIPPCSISRNIFFKWTNMFCNFEKYFLERYWAFQCWGAVKFLLFNPLQFLFLPLAPDFLRRLSTKTVRQNCRGVSHPKYLFFSDFNMCRFLSFHFRKDFFIQTYKRKVLEKAKGAKSPLLQFSNVPVKTIPSQPSPCTTRIALFFNACQNYPIYHANALLYSRLSGSMAVIDKVTFTSG